MDGDKLKDDKGMMTRLVDDTGMRTLLEDDTVGERLKDDMGKDDMGMVTPWDNMIHGWMMSP